MQILYITDKKEYCSEEKMLTEMSSLSFVHTKEDACDYLYLHEKNISAKQESLLPQLIILDAEGHIDDSRDLLQKINEKTFLLNIPILVLIESSALHFLEEFLYAGAQDYLKKPYAEVEFRVRVRSLLRTREEFEKRRDSEREIKSLEVLASRDELTGLYNRREFEMVSNELWAEAIKDKTSFSVFIMDIDYFKKYNDTYGHLKGDYCLKEVGNLLFSIATKNDCFVARIGGEEFVLLSKNLSYVENVSLGESICSGIRALDIAHKSSRVSKILTISCGGAFITPTKDDELNDAMRAADNALYVAKRAGRNRLEFAEL